MVGVRKFQVDLRDNGYLTYSEISGFVQVVMPDMMTPTPLNKLAYELPRCSCASSP